MPWKKSLRNAKAPRKPPWFIDIGTWKFEWEDAGRTVPLLRAYDEASETIADVRMSHITDDGLRWEIRTQYKGNTHRYRAHVAELMFTFDSLPAVAVKDWLNPVLARELEVEFVLPNVATKTGDFITVPGPNPDNMLSWLGVAVFIHLQGETKRELHEFFQKVANRLW